MNMKEHPSNVKLSRAGHSIGHWEGDTLVVDTTGFLPGFLNTPVANSDQLHVIERFELEPKKMALTRSYVAEDPVYLKGKYTGSDTIMVADAPYNPGKCKELNFIDYSKEAQTLETRLLTILDLYVLPHATIRWIYMPLPPMCVEQPADQTGNGAGVLGVAIHQQQKIYMPRVRQGVPAARTAASRGAMKPRMR